MVRAGWVRGVFAWSPAIFYGGAILFLSSRPNLHAPGALPHLDKAAHFVEYAILGALLRRGFSGHGPGARGALVGAAFVAAGFGLGDEWLQSHIPGRVASLADWGADAVGGSAGAWLARWWPRMGPTGDGRLRNGTARRPGRETEE